MARRFISFLGTSPYLECCYRFNEKITSPVRFVQESTIGFCCRDWGDYDRVLIFATAEAENRNWVDNGHGDGQMGLAARLARLKLKCPVQMVHIPEGHDESQIWDIFALVLEQLKHGDEVLFDITHAFRSIPLLAMVILNYAKVAFNARLIGIYYGAFEVLGNPRRVEKELPDPKSRVVPLLDLTPLDRLLDWSFAVDKWIKAGDATALQALARASLAPLLKESQGKNPAAAAFRRLGDSLKQFTMSMSTCRSKEISKNALLLKEVVDECGRADLVSPLKPLLARIENEVSRFRQDPVADGIQSARWCLEHHLIQQGITILYETLVTWCLVAAGERGLISDKDARMIASQALDIVKRQRPEHAWEGGAKKDPVLTRRLVNMIHACPGVAKAASILREYRNDINHSGMGANCKSAELFAKKLGEQLNSLENLLVA